MYLNDDCAEATRLGLDGRFLLAVAAAAGGGHDDKFDCQARALS